MLAAVTRLSCGNLRHFIIHFVAHGVYEYNFACFLALKLPRVGEIQRELFHFCLETEYNGESVVQRRLDYAYFGRRIKANVTAVLWHGKKMNVEDRAVCYYSHVGLVFRPFKRFKEGTFACHLKMIFKTYRFQLFA